MLRNSVRHVAWADRKSVVAALKSIYSADTEQAAEAALEVLREGHETEVPDDFKVVAGQLATRDPVPGLSREIRKASYTTNVIESLNFQLRRIIKRRGHFPSDDAALQAVVPGAVPRAGEMDNADQELEKCAKPTLTVSILWTW